MKYLKSMKSYLFRLLVMTLLCALVLLFYFFTMLVFYKFHGESAILLNALKNYGLFLLYSLPLIVIFASTLYFAFTTMGDKKFTMVMVPIVSAVNTVILLVFFFLRIDFTSLEKPLQAYFYPEVRQGIINSIKDSKLYVDKMDRGSIDSGILFSRNAYLGGSGSVGWDTVNVNAYQAVGDNGLTGQGTSFHIPRKEPVLQIQETGISRALFQSYINYVKKLRGIFTNTFVTNVPGGVLYTALAIFLMCIGFFGIISGIAVYFNEKQIMALSYSALAVIAVLMFLSFPYFLSLITLIKFGIKNGFFKVFLPSLFVGGLTALVGYGLLELRQLMLKRSGNR